MSTLTAEHRSLGGKAAAEQRRADREELAKLREWFRNQATPKIESETPQQAEAYINSRLVRVRKQLDRLDRMILTEEEPQKLDRLISATSRLEEQERKLSGRFAPGTTKPAAARTRATPQPVVYSVPVAQPSIVSGSAPTNPSNDNGSCA